MRFRFLNHPHSVAALGLSRKISGTNGFVALGAALCAQGIIAGPLHAAPTLGGDEEGPKVQILQPGYQDLLKGSAKIVVGIQVNRFNPDTIEMLVDDNAVLLPTKLASTASLGFDWDTTKFTDGPHKLTVRITDTQGYRGWAEVYVYINNSRKRDNVPPQLGWLSVKQGQILTGTQQINLKAVDNFGVKWIIVSLNPEATPDAKPPLRSWLVGAKPYSFNFDTTVVQDGIYVLQAKAWDLYEQEGNAPPLYIGVSNNLLSSTTMQERLDLLAKGQNATTAENFQVPNVPTPVAKEIPANATSYGSGTTPKIVDPSAGYGRGTSSSTHKTSEGTAPAKVEAPANGDLSRYGKTYKGALETNAGNILDQNVAESRSTTTPSRTSVPTLATRTVPSVPAGRPTTRVAASSEARPKNPFVGTSEIDSAPQLSEGTGGSPRTATAVAAAVEPKLPTVRTEVKVQPANPRLARREVEVPPASFSTPRSMELGASAPTATNLRSEKLIADLRMGSPRSEKRELPTWDQADLSAPKSLPTVRPRIAALPKAEIESSPVEPQHMAAPGGEPRVLTGEAAMTVGGGNSAKTTISGPQTGTPINAEKSGYEPASTAPAGEARTVPGLIAKAIDNVKSFVGLGGATLSSTTGPEISGAERLPLNVEAEASSHKGRTSVPSTLAAPTVVKEEKGPQLSSNPRLAMRPNTNSRQGAISAITVSPLTLESARALPAFHTVQNTTTLRAVAFHYGIPVDVLAASNGTKADSKLTAGSKVKMPQELQISYGGKAVKGDVNSLLVGSTTVTPFRFLWEQQGGKLEWDATKKQVVATNAEHKIVLEIGSRTAKVDDREVMMELAAFLMSGRTMVPVRVFEEGLHAQVEWDPQTGRLFVAMASNAAA